MMGTRRWRMRRFGDSSSGGGGGVPGAVGRADSIETVGNPLLTVDVTDLDSGDQIYVGNESFPNQPSIQDLVRVRRDAALTPTEGEVWNSATAGVQFERLHTPSNTHLQRLVWTVTNDDGLGTSIIDNAGFGANPVSMREMNRRRAGDSQGIGGAIFVQIPDMTAPARSELLACTLSNWWGTDGNAAPVLIGIVATNLYAGTVVAFTPAVHGAGTGYILQAVGIGTAFALDPTRVQALVQLASLAKTAVIQEAIDADHVRVNQPRTGDASSYTVGVTTTFAPGDSIIVPNLPKLPIWPYVPGAFEFSAVGQLDLSGFENQFNSCDFGNGSPFIINCLFDSAGLKGGNSGASIGSVGFRGFGYLSVGQLSLWSVALGRGLTAGVPVVGRMNILNGGLFETLDNFDLENCQVLARGGHLQIDNDLSCFGFAAAAPAMLRADLSGEISISEQWWGGVTSANACRLAQISPGARLDLTAANVLVTTSTSPDDFNVIDGGPGVYPRNAISIINPLGGGVIDATILRSPGAVTFQGVLNTSNGVPTAVFLGNPGSFLSFTVSNTATGGGPAANQTDQQCYPASRRILRSLHVVKRTTTCGVNVVVTVYIAGGTTPTAMTITILNADPVGTQYTYDAVPIVLGSPQDFDVRMSAAIDAAAGAQFATVTVQLG